MSAIDSFLEGLGAEERELVRPQPPPTWIAPMLATLTQDRFSDPRWLYERKLDGERCLAFCHDGRVRLMTRNRKRIEATYPEIAEALEAQHLEDAVFDGEIVAFDGDRTSFARLQGRMQQRDADKARRSGIAVYYYLFDVPHWRGHDVGRLPLRRRKSLLRQSLTFADPLRMSTHRLEEGEEYYRQACERGWEGVIAKRADGVYRGGRSRDWLKFKCDRGQELVIGGFTDPQGSRSGFGALLVGYYDAGDLTYAGKVGTGFTQSVLADLRDRMDALAADRPAFSRNLDHLPRKGVHWVRPELVAEFGFSEWTRDGMLRHPRYRGLRRDKDAKDVTGDA